MAVALWIYFRFNFIILPRTLPFHSSGHVMARERNGWLAAILLMMITEEHRHRQVHWIWSREEGHTNKPN